MDTLIAIDQPAPDFALADLDGARHALADYRGRIVILNFWSAECPWSARADLELRTYLEPWGAQVALLNIASNANESLELVRRVAGERELPLVLLDTDQRVADLYGAQITPHLFVADSGGVLRYQGAFDDVTFRQREPTRPYLRLAVDALLAGKPPDPAHQPPYGCTLVRHAP